MQMYSLCQDVINTEMADKIMSEFFTTDFEGGRHQARIDKIPVK